MTRLSGRGLRSITTTSRGRRRLAWLVPLTLLSGVLTVDLVVAGGRSAGPQAAVLPDGSAPPVEAVRTPASYSVPGSIGLGVPQGRAAQVVATSSTNGIPTAALAAYQRAQTVINSTDTSCHLPWQLLAAVGRVESDHGRYGGSVLTTSGVSRPGIYGIRLDGRNHTTTIRDSDAGMYDHDQVYDRAVGPMQFIPATWATVGVDADGDGRRNPQDIDDASLAAAVYLCSGTDDLSTGTGRRAAVYRYNHSTAYVNLVLALMDGYLAGDYTAVPNYTTSAITFIPDRHHTAPGQHGTRHQAAGTGNHDSAAPPTTEPPASPAPSEPVDDDPASTIADTVKNAQEGIKDRVIGTVKTVDQVLTLAQASFRCATEGLNPLLTRAAWDDCIERYTT